MGLINFKDWLTKIKESSPTTRARNAFMWGLAPPSAGMTSHSTPHPVAFDKLDKALRKKKRRKKKNG